MNQSQYERLQELSEKLADVAIQDANPEHWVGRGKKPADLTKEERGDAYWCRKIAVSTLSLLSRVHSLIGQVQLHGGVMPGAPAAAATSGEAEEAGEEEQRDNLEEEVLAYEKEAAKLLRDMQADSKKAATDKRQNGRKAG